MHPLIILASSSPYRRQQFTQLGLAFMHENPLIDERPMAGETPSALAQRLSLAKAQAVAANHTSATVIGSDQVGELDGQLLGKPGNRTNAVRQLMQCSGRTVEFHTGVCVLSPQHTDCQSITTQVTFRSLSEQQIQAYIDREHPFDCAGSFKCEGLGIALFKAVRSDDPSALIGLPLIALNQMLYQAGIDVLA